MALAFVFPAQGKEHWAYLPLQQASIEVNSAQHPIDQILAPVHKNSKIVPNQLTTPQAWLQRAAYTLTGLPPSIDQLSRLDSSPTEETYNALLDELLATPTYGERWARHWMDVARYADTRGYLPGGKDIRYPYAYTYRDWLIRAFNQDLPYPQFIEKQLAADLVVENPNHPDLAALGFLTVGHRQKGSLLTYDDQVDVITRGFLGTTVSCARCHDHKSDPISMEDYYSLFNILAHTKEPEPPIIGKPASEEDHRDFLAKIAEVEGKRNKHRQDIHDQLRKPEQLAVYLELTFLAHHENWDDKTIARESFKRGRFREAIVGKFKQLIQDTLESGPAALKIWHAEMEPAKSRAEHSLKFAQKLLSAPEGTPLAKWSHHQQSPLTGDLQSMDRFLDRKDRARRTKHNNEVEELKIKHPGSPPRAMILRDKDKIKRPRIYDRGNPATKGEPFEPRWLEFLGHDHFPQNVPPRLYVARKIADPTNPLTNRVIANRVWAWHFGQALTTPSDYGYDRPSPKLLSLLDHLALFFQKNGSSLKKLHKHILTSKTFRLDSTDSSSNNSIDQANTLYWKWHPQRLDFESLRDRILHQSGSLNLAQQGGPSRKLSVKEMRSRRTLYSFIDRYTLDQTFVSFDLPHPNHHHGKRVATIVPQQSLYLMNGPEIIREATKLAKHPDLQERKPSTQADWIYLRLFQRLPTRAERQIATSFLTSAKPEDDTGDALLSDFIQMLWASNQFHFVN